MIKVGPFILWIIKRHIERAFKKKRKSYPLDVLPCKLDHPFIDDGNEFHKMDIIYAKENRKNACVIDIHGGAYMYCRHRDNYMFGLEMAKQGYDFIAIDYIPNNGKRDTKDLVDDCVKAINYIYDHQKELNLEGDIFFLTGDSAGGHLALLIAEAIGDKNVANKLGYDFKDMKIKGVLLNCPVYEYESISDKGLSKRGAKRMFGPRALDKQWLKITSPKTYIEQLNVPVFLSTCKHDFLKEESYKLKKDLDQYGKCVTYIDLDTDEKGIDHVHNVVRPQKELSQFVNSKMIEFMDKLI